ALLDAIADRLLAIEERRIASYTGGWADYAQAQSAEPPPAEEPQPKPRRKRPPRAAKSEPTPLELIEAEVARAEERVADLEQKLSLDWSDLGLLTAHREARADLEALLKRWEALFEERGSNAR